jgi:hypothetical protein
VIPTDHKEGSREEGFEKENTGERVHREIPAVDEVAEQEMLELPWNFKFRQDSEELREVAV